MGKFVRGIQVRAVLDKPGRGIMEKFKAQFKEILKQRASMSESAYLAKTAALAGRLRDKMHTHRSRNIDTRRMSTYTLRSRHSRSSDKEKKLRIKGAIQPVRTSVFEPMTTALAKLEPSFNPRYAKNSRVLVQVFAMKKKLDRTMPKEVTFKAHAAAKRGRGGPCAAHCQEAQGGASN